MPTFQLRTPAGNLQASWTSGMRRRLCAPGQHYRTCNTLKALFVNRRSFKPKSQLPRSILILDEKSVIRHLAVSSLSMDDLMESVRWEPIYDFNVLIDWEPLKKYDWYFFLLFPPVWPWASCVKLDQLLWVRRWLEKKYSIRHQLLTTKNEFPFQGRKSSFLDKLWRTNLKLPETPQTSLKRSVSREVTIISICFKVA